MGHACRNSIVLVTVFAHNVGLSELSEHIMKGVAFAEVLNRVKFLLSLVNDRLNRLRAFLVPDKVTYLTAGVANRAMLG